MGMFDDITVDRDRMPEGYQQEDFVGQTKSMECCLAEYYIDSLGALYRNGEPENYHGDIHFHGWTKEAVNMQYFVARFTEGELQWIKECE